MEVSKEAALSASFLPALDLNYARVLLLDFARTGGSEGLLAAGVSALGLLVATGLVVHRTRQVSLPGGWVAKSVTFGFGVAAVAMLWLNQFVLAICSLCSRSVQRPRALATSDRGRHRWDVVPTQASDRGRAGLADPVPPALLCDAGARSTGCSPCMGVHGLTLLASTAVAFGRARLHGDGMFFLGSVILGLLLGMGLFQSPYVIHRYTFYLLPLLVVLHAAAWSRIAGRLSVSRAPWTAYLALALCLLVSGQFAPAEAWRSTHVRYGYGHEQLSDPDLTSHFRYDFRGAATFLARNTAPGDLILAKDPVELRAYGIESDARINDLYSVYARDPNGVAVDWYLAIPILHSREMLLEWIERARGERRRVYVVVPEEVAGGPAVHLPEEMKAWIEETAPAHEVFRAPDRITRILRYDP
ncbi:MAG: hypothetical protein R3E97_20975 [Candidatus Eisenbacteria bacterium]